VTGGTKRLDAVTMKVELELYDCRELSIAYDAMDRIQAHRDSKRWPDGGGDRCKVTPLHPPNPIQFVPVQTVGSSEEVPPVPLETVLEEIHAAEAVADPIVGDAALPAASVEDAVGAMRAALDRGVQMPAIVAILTEKQVKRVPELNDFDRADFTVRVKELKGKGA
jgi:hypothetical protein